MPKFFSRRYMRGKPKRTERVIGGVILVVLLLVLGGFVDTSGLFPALPNLDKSVPGLARLKAAVGLETEPSGDPASVAPPSAAVEARVAALLLPDGIAGWTRRAVAPLILDNPGAEHSPAIKAVLESQPRHLYRAEYQAQDTKEQTSVLLADCGDAAASRKLYQARSAAGARPLRIGVEGQADQSVIRFWSGRYYTELEGGSTVEGLARAVAQQQVAYTDAPASAAGENEPARAARPATGKPAAAANFPDVGGGIVAPPKIERYTDNLYEKIDGREGQFRAFHFVELRFGQYLDSRRQETFDVYLYDMGEPVNAMGIAASERSESPEPLDVGRDGYLSGVNAYFWKNRYYVNVLGPADAGAEAAATTRKIAAAVDATIPDDAGSFWADDFLPKEGRGPLKFAATSALGHDFLENMYLADYGEGEQKYSLVILKAADAAAAKALFEKLAEATAKYDKVLSRQPSEGGETLLAESLDVYAAYFHAGRYLGGAVECAAREQAEKLAAALRERVAKEESSDGSR